MYLCIYIHTRAFGILCVYRWACRFARFGKCDCMLTYYREFFKSRDQERLYAYILTTKTREIYSSTSTVPDRRMYNTFYSNGDSYTRRGAMHFHYRTHY